MRGHISMLAVSGRRSSCCSSLLFKAEFFSLSIAARKERADLSLCDHFEHPSTFKHSCGKPRLARVCQALCFAGASGVMRPHPSPWPRCQGPLVLDPAIVQGHFALSWVLAAGSGDPAPAASWPHWKKSEPPLSFIWNCVCVCMESMTFSAT